MGPDAPSPPADFLQCLQPWVRAADFFFSDLPTSEADDLGKLLLAETYASAEVTLRPGDASRRTAILQMFDSVCGDMLGAASAVLPVS